MAYYLEFDGDSYVYAATLGNVLSQSTIRVESDKFRWDTSGNAGYWFSQAVSSSGSREIGVFSFSGELRILVGGANSLLLSPSDISSEFGSSVIQAETFAIELNLVNGAYSLERDGVIFDSGTVTLGTSRLDGTLFRLGARANSNTAGDTSGGYEIVSGSQIGNTRVFLNGNLVRNYNKQTLSGSNDTVFPDTAGDNDGTLVNFPTDNSQWVFFDDGGGAVTVDGATAIPSLTATGNASATLPQPSLSASISLTQLSATGSASATLPNPQLDAAIAFNAFTATGNASVTLPQPDASGSITFNTPTVAGSASATLPQPTLQAAVTLPVVTANGSASATLPGFNLSASVNIPTLTAKGAAQATLPQPVVSASITMPSLTALGAAEATEPSFTVSGNITLQPPTVTGSVSATLPQPSISGNIALPSIQASGFIIGGEIVITVELETNINEPQLSVNITEPKLSTNITE